MLKRVQQWLKDGDQVVVFTSRITESGSAPGLNLGFDHTGAKEAIEAWCQLYLGQTLPVTNIKGFFHDLWDDRAVGVIPNTGLPIGYPETYKKVANLVTKPFNKVLYLLVGMSFLLGVLGGAGIAAWYIMKNSIVMF